MAVKGNLVSIPTLVESPFVIVTIGGVTFGGYNAKGRGNQVSVQYPNFVKSLQVTKINGTVNVYSLKLSYQVGFGEDPNLLDKIISRASNNRMVTFEYGDYNSPKNIYKSEVAILTKVSTNLNMSNSSIDYTLECTGDALGLTAVNYNFPARKAKPSDVLKQMLSNSRYKLKEVFPGMKDSQIVNQLNMISSTDKPVDLEAKIATNIITYMNYLVGCMKSNSKDGESTYMLSIHDDYNKEAGGTFFRVTEVSGSPSSYISADTYEIDINYPDDNFVTQFSLSDDQSWAILYEYSKEAKVEEYVYKINNQGEVVTEYAPQHVRNKANHSVVPYKDSWWTKMTQFPVQATLTIKGLTRPTLLMSYVRVHVWFHGAQKHISSGVYIITKQVDTIDASGYKTTLSLTRVGEDA